MWQIKFLLTSSLIGLICYFVSFKEVWTLSSKLQGISKQTGMHVFRVFVCIQMNSWCNPAVICMQHRCINIPYLITFLWTYKLLHKLWYKHRKNCFLRLILTFAFGKFCFSLKMTKKNQICRKFFNFNAEYSCDSYLDLNGFS